MNIECSSGLILSMKPRVQSRMNQREVVQPGPFLALGLVMVKGDVQVVLPKK